jgi:tetratricopeptide (TPR) repeat protein
MLRDRRGPRHHARECAACRALLHELFPSEPPPRACRAHGVLPWRPRPADYGAAVDGLLTSFAPRVEAVARERAAAPWLLDELLCHAPERRALLLRNSVRFRSLVLCDLLLRAAREESELRPASGEALARLALGALELLASDVYGPGVLADFRARAWAVVGEARRLAGDLAAAQAALVTALRHLRHGTGDELEHAQIVEQVAALRRRQGRWADALRLLARSARTYRWLGERQLEARALVEGGCAWWDRGEPARALALLRRAERRLDPGLDPALAARLRSRLADCLAATGHPLEAQAVLARARRFGASAPRRRRAGRAPDGLLRLVEG